MKLKLSRMRLSQCINLVKCLRANLEVPNFSTNPSRRFSNHDISGSQVVFFRVEALSEAEHPCLSQVQLVAESNFPCSTLAPEHFAHPPFEIRDDLGEFDPRRFQFHVISEVEEGTTYSGQ